MNDADTRAAPATSSLGDMAAAPWGSASPRGLTACWIMVPAWKVGVFPALSWQLLALPESRGAPKRRLPWSET